MKTAQLIGGTQSCGVTSRGSEWNFRNRTTGSFCSTSSRGLCNFASLVDRKRLSQGFFLPRRSRLSANHSKLLLSSPLSCQRKHTFSAVNGQLGSDCGVHASSVEEETYPMEDNLLTIPSDKAHVSTEDPSSQPHFQDVKRALIMLSLPAIAGQALEPLATLMETAYIGQLGPTELASAGVSMSVFNIISKLFNMPLLSVATSFVAEDISKLESTTSISEESLGESGNGKSSSRVAKREQLSSVSSALLLAVAIGSFEALALYLGSGAFLSRMGISLDSPMRSPAQQFLSLRALGAPALVVSLALQGIFRGFKDTKTPVLCLGVGNLSAMFLFPLLMYYFKWGVTGAAISTVISQYVVAFLMIWHLNKRAVLLPPKLRELQFGGYVESGGFLIGRTLAVLITLTLATAMAARQGPIAMAAHQVCLQVWLAVSLLTDALAASCQALMASSLSRGDYRTLKELANFVLKIGLLTGVSLAVILGVSFGSLATLFTKDAEVLGVVRTGVLFVSVSQPLNALAFIFDGLHYGVSDFSYAASSMMVVGAISSAFLLYASPIFGLQGVWSGLGLFMGLRMVAGYIRISSKDGPWWFLHKDLEIIEENADLDASMISS